MNSSRSFAADVDLDPARLPAHVAVIMDGNGRWAKKQLLGRVKGHEQGSETVRSIVRACRKIGIPNLTLFAFSTENWQRPKAEISALMHLLKRFLQSERRELMEKNIRLSTIGEIDRLPETVRRELDSLMRATRDNDSMRLNLALSYGGRAEIVRMVKTIVGKVQDEEIRAEEITEDLVAGHLYTGEMPDPDLLIRTSGEMRVSNFLLWQIAYSEIYVTDTLWPDFSEEEFCHILKDFQCRERRFGRVPKQ